MSQLDITAVLTVRNAEAYLRQAIESVLAQTLIPAEIILVDGQSQDGTQRIAALYPTVRYLLQPDLGLANARNLGVRSVRTRWIAFLDGDDMWPPQKLERQAMALEAAPQALYCIGSLRFLEEPGTPENHRRRQRLLREGQPAYTPGALLARVDLFDRMGLFNPAYAVACDTEWFGRLLDARVPGVVISEEVLQKRIHDTNLSWNTPIYRREVLQALRGIVKARKIAAEGEAPGEDA